jgi:alpha/beta hydrolase family protein
MQRSPQFPSRRSRGFATATIAVVVLGVFASLAGAAPAVSTPPTGGGAILPANLNAFDLGQVGYQQSEFFLQGTATAFHPTAPLTSNGMWSVAAGTDPPSAPAPYKTRVVVYRPIDPQNFNGTVVVEWLNVSGLIDADPDWTQTHNELIRDGFAWVGVSAQAVGLNALKCSGACIAPGDPVRRPAKRSATTRRKSSAD